jgi:hypothetical protein
MREIVNAIVTKHKRSGIDLNAPATANDISNFEQQIGALHYRLIL